MARLDFEATKELRVMRDELEKLITELKAVLANKGDRATFHQLLLEGIRLLDLGRRSRVGGTEPTRRMQLCDLRSTSGC
jgi:hypothetical protein